MDVVECHAPCPIEADQGVPQVSSMHLDIVHLNGNQAGVNVNGRKQSFAEHQLPTGLVSGSLNSEILCAPIDNIT